MDKDDARLEEVLAWRPVRIIEEDYEQGGCKLFTCEDIIANGFSTEGQKVRPHWARRNTCAHD